MAPPSLITLARDRAALLALRVPLSWVNVATGEPTEIDGRTLDARAQWLLKVFEKSGRKPTHTLPLAEARAQFEAGMKAMSASLLPMGLGAPPIGEIVDRTIPGPAGPLPIRIYRPAGVRPAAPAILFLHGGSWNLGGLDAYDDPCRFLASASGCVVIGLDYRLAPEHPFPAAVEDSTAAWRWLASNAESLELSPRRLVVAGDSAGGNLAATVAQATRHDAVPPALQLLIYPALDLRMTSRSYDLYAEGFLLTKAGMEWARGMYLADPSEADDPRASPGLEPDLSGLPPALIFTAGFDVLRDEAVAYAERLREAGVKTMHREFPGLIHGFVGMRGTLQAAARAMDDIAGALRHELALVA